MDFVAAPIHATEAKIARRLRDRFSRAVSTYVGETPGDFSDERIVEETAEVVQVLARVHSVACTTEHNAATAALSANGVSRIPIRFHQLPHAVGQGERVDGLDEPGIRAGPARRPPFVRPIQQDHDGALEGLGRIAQVLRDAERAYPEGDLVGDDDVGMVTWPRPLAHRSSRW